jgi:hypothetical protein
LEARISIIRVDQIAFLMLEKIIAPLDETNFFGDPGTKKKDEK